MMVHCCLLLLLAQSPPTQTSFPASKEIRVALGKERLPSFDGEVYCVSVLGEHLFVGGDFTHGGEVAVRNIARVALSTHAVDALEGGVFASRGPNVVYSLAVDEQRQQVFAAGVFDRAGALECSGLARFALATRTWDVPGKLIVDLLPKRERPSAGAPRSPTLKPFAGTLLRVADGLWVGGRFTRVGAQDATGLARLDLTSGEWSGVPDGLFAPVTSPLGDESPGDARDLVLVAKGDVLMVAGKFARAGTVDASALAAYDIERRSWSVLGGGLTLDRRALGMSEAEAKEAQMPTAPEAFEVTLVSGAQRNELWLSGAISGAVNVVKGARTEVASRFLACWDLTSHEWVPTELEPLGPVLALAPLTRPYPAVLLALTLADQSVILLHSGRKHGFARLGDTFSRASGEEAIISDLFVAKDGIYVGGTFDRYGKEPVGNLVFLRFQ